jgi:hypothetical protein
MTMSPSPAPSEAKSGSLSTRLTHRDTPTVIKQSPKFHRIAEQGLEVSGAAVSHDLGSYIAQLPFDAFKNDILPPLRSSINISDVIARLKQIRVISSKGRWKYFSRDPAYYAKLGDNHKLEDRVFQNMAPLINNIVANSGCQEASMFEYLSLPRSPPVSLFDSKCSIPDGYFISVTRNVHNQSRHYWYDIVAPAEYKCTDTQAQLQDVRSFIIIKTSLISRIYTIACG